MKYFLLQILILIAFADFSQSQENKVDSKGRKQGEWVKFHKSSRVPQYKGQFKDDKPVGKFTYYYPSNKVKAIIIHDENSPRSEAYFYHENKKLMAYGIYKNQEKDSVWSHYDPRERLSYKETFKNGELHGKKIIYFVTSSSPNQNNKKEISQELHYENGRLNGPTKEYFPGGTLKLEGKYKEGKFDGVVKRYHPNGKLHLLERYKDRRRHGWWITYDNNEKELGRKYYYKGRALEGEELKKKMEYFKENDINPNK